MMAEGRTVGVEWEGTATSGSGRQMDEMAAHDLARSGYPLATPLAAELAF